MLSAIKAMQLLKELLEIDEGVRRRKVALTFVQKQRRMTIASELARWAMASRPAPKGHELRQHPRADMKVRLELLGGPQSVSLETDTLGLGGAGVAVRFPARRGDVWRMRLWPPEGDDPVELQAEVVWVDVPRARCGLRFLEQTDELRAVIERLVFSELIRS